MTMCSRHMHQDIFLMPETENNLFHRAVIFSYVSFGDGVTILITGNKGPLVS